VTTTNGTVRNTENLDRVKCLTRDTGRSFVLTENVRRLLKRHNSFVKLPGCHNWSKR